VVVPLNKVAEEAQKQLQDFLRFQPNPKMKMRKKKTCVEVSGFRFCKNKL